MTDREKDIQTAKSLIGKPNSYFKPIWQKFASGWDGASCSETACCISYLAGNLSKIYVSNYAAGLVAKFKMFGRFGHEPVLGAFIWFDYKDGQGASHTGRVVEVGATTIKTIEGNINNQVVSRTYYKDSPYIYGYGYPNYTDEDIDMTYQEKMFLSEGIKDVALSKGCDYPNLVTFVQNYLQYYGYYDGTVDGDFGTYTESAVKKWQKERGLYVDGIIGQYSWAEIMKG